MKTWTDLALIAIALAIGVVAELLVYEMWTVVVRVLVFARRPGDVGSLSNLRVLLLLRLHVHPLAHWLPAHPPSRIVVVRTAANVVFMVLRPLASRRYGNMVMP